jgi:hypothetical protein
MSLIQRNKAQSPRQTELPKELQLLTLKEAAEMLRLNESTIRQSRAGTAHLTKIRQGGGKRQRVFLVRLEVENHIRQMIEEAQRKNERPFKIVYGI